MHCRPSCVIMIIVVIRKVYIITLHGKNDKYKIPQSVILIYCYLQSSSSCYYYYKEAIQLEDSPVYS